MGGLRRLAWLQALALASVGDLGLVSTCNLIFHLGLAAAYDPICVKENSDLQFRQSPLRMSTGLGPDSNTHWQPEASTLAPL
jgi:hypothetical protein